MKEEVSGENNNKATTATTTTIKSETVTALPATPPPSKKSTTKTTTSNNTNKRRSARVLNHDPIIAPGFGTRKDIENLSSQLSQQQGGTHFPVEAVEQLMKCRGRGIRGGADNDDEDDNKKEAPAAAVSTAWADFMMEEGVAVGGAAASQDDGDDKKKSGSRSSRGGSDTKQAAAGASSNKKRSYELTFDMPSDEPTSAKKKKKSAAASAAGAKRDTIDDDEGEGGVLLQTGTLDTTIVGRSKAKMDLTRPYHLFEPTRIMLVGPAVKISKVFTSCNSCHSIAIDTEGRPYGWGRNETNALGSNLPKQVVVPTLLTDTLPEDISTDSPVRAAGLGKGHTILLLQDGTMWGVGSNKSGQCGVRTFTDAPNWRKCVLPELVSFVQISCGEDFSVALSSEGHVYSTGSAEYGQLGNGETGEHFITANKIAFANCNVFTRRSTFCHAPNEKLWINNEKPKVVPLIGDDADVRIQAVACGKHHALAIEAASDQKPRVFSWGCGDYGCLGHGVQADEYYPRNIGAMHNINTTGPGVKITAGAHCSLLQLDGGHVYYWGKHRSVGEATMRPQLVDVLANNQHVVTCTGAGAQTVVCSTRNAQTVAWGQGSYGELGLGTKQKSSSKPTFVTALDGCLITDMACGYGHTLFVARQQEKEDIEAVNKLPQISEDDVEPLIEEIIAE